MSYQIDFSKFSIVLKIAFIPSMELSILKQGLKQLLETIEKVMWHF